ncbi:MAG: lipopolysaccharide heptosyltransferase II [SAR324 cluster bacterium]|nr:lipopolysaccharide heptosyltransferase II [SAR324 cluster bacterium]
MSSSNPQKIVIRTPNWLGDLMMSTAFINAVLAKFPEARVDLIVRAGFEQLPLPHRGSVLAFDKQKQSAGNFGRMLRKEGYDNFYILPPSFSSAWMAFCSGVPNRIGYAGNFRKTLLRPAKSYQSPPRSQHLVKEYLTLLDEDLSLETHRPFLRISDSWVEQQLKKKQLPEKFAVFATGAIYGAAKQWPVSHFRQLAEQLVEPGQSILLVGTKADHDEGEKICKDLQGVQNLCGQTSLTELVAILAKAELLVSNDSGTMHIMTALQRPQIAIFGSTSPTWTGPLNPNAQVHYLELSCSPCFQRKCPFGHYRCLQQITPDQILSKRGQSPLI